MTYERNSFDRVSEAQAEKMVTEIEARLGQFKQQGAYPITEAYKIDRELLFLEKNFIPSYEKDALVMEEGIDGSSLTYNQITRAQNTSHTLKKLWPKSHDAAYEKMKQRSHRERTFWEFKFIMIPSRSEVDVLEEELLFLALACITLFCLKMHSINWKFRSLFNRSTLQITGYFIAVFLSTFQGAAVAQQFSVKIKKTKVGTEQLLSQPDEDTPVADPPHTPPLATLNVHLFSDTTRESQIITTTNVRIAPRFSASMFTQWRRAMNGSTMLSYVGFGGRYAFSKQLTVLATTGPQYAHEKDRFDQWSAFVIANVDVRSFHATLINRFSRGTDGVAIDAHRHIIVIRAGPMPAWISGEYEIKKSKRILRESLLGPNISFGKLLWKPSNWLSGLYVYPYYDFVLRSADVRFGWTKSFLRK